MPGTADFIQSQDGPAWAPDDDATPSAYSSRIPEWQLEYLELGSNPAVTSGTLFAEPPEIAPELCDPDELLAARLEHALAEHNDAACTAALREPRDGQRATGQLLRQVLHGLNDSDVATRERAALVLRKGGLPFWHTAPWEARCPSDDAVNRLRATGVHPILVARYACQPHPGWGLGPTPLLANAAYDKRLAWLKLNIPRPFHSTPGFSAQRDVFAVPSVLRNNPEAWQGRFAVTIEKGTDQGGPTRDWLTQMLRGCADPTNKILEGRGRDNAQLFFHSSLAGPLSDEQKEDVALFGHLLAKAITEALPCPELFVSPRLLAQLAGHDIASGVNELAEIDDDAATTLRNMLTLSAEQFAALSMPFSLKDPANPMGPETPLKPNQPNLLVNVDNVEEFVRLKAQAMLDAYNPALEIFAKAFYSTGVNLPLLQPFTVAELDNIVSGERVFSVDDWRNNTRVTRPTGSSHGVPTWETTNVPKEFPEVVQWFFEIAEELPKHERQKLLWLITASSTPPAGGFKNLRPEPFKITVAADARVALSAHTCFCQLDLPNYKSREELQAQIKMWIAEKGKFNAS